VSLREVSDPLGPPWSEELQGTFHRHIVESEILANNPLGDPSRRPLFVYEPPGGGRGLPSIYLIQGMTGQLDMWMNRNAFEPTIVERIDALFAGDAPPALVVFVDAWTSYGGSQFINSAGTGRYMDYLCDEVVAFIDETYRTIPEAGSRGLTGKSSGGYGAMVVPMLRPDVFGALASHSGDALFEACYLKDFPETARVLRDRFDGSFERFFDKLRADSRLEWGPMGAALNVYAMAACYSPDHENPGKARLPFDIETGRLIDEVWAEWLDWDPVRMAPKYAEALRSMKLIYLDAGRSDEYFLDLGAQAFAKELDALDISYELELFDGKHGGISYRYPRAIRALAEVLSSGVGS
jgi:S-formylglutathione hydrolase FrmB